MAVFTEVSDRQLQDFLAAYDLGPLRSWEGIAQGYENSNFRLETERGRYVLTLFERRVQAADLPFFLGLMGHLADHKVLAPHPVADRSGQVIGQLAGKPAAIVTFLDGHWKAVPNAEDCRAVGGALAGLHLAGQSFEMRRANDIGIAAWVDLLATCGAQADQVAPGLFDDLSREIDHLRRVWPQDLPRGVIHGDLFPDNLFFEGGRVSGIIDFYFACTDLLAYDLAIVINAWCFDPTQRFDPTLCAALLDGYNQHRRLADDERAALGCLGRGAAVRFLLTRLHDWLFPAPGLVVQRKDPMEYHRILTAHRQGLDYGR